MSIIRRGTELVERGASCHLRDVRFERNVQLLHQLGPRALAEFLGELGAERLLRSEIEAKLRRYTRLDPDAVRALGADQFASMPLYLIRQ